MGHGQYLDAKRVGALLVKGQEMRINSKDNFHCTTNEVYSQRNLYWVPLRLLSWKTKIDLSFARDLGELEHTRRMYLLYREIMSEIPPVFGLVCY